MQIISPRTGLIPALLLIHTLGLIHILGPLVLPVADAAEGPIVLYSGRKQKLMRPVVRAFEKETGIKVIMRTGNATALVNQLMEERSAPRADAFVTLYAPILNRLSEAKVLAPYRSSATDKIPSMFRAKDRTWTGVTTRLRVIMFNTKLLTWAEAPKTIAELASPKWKGKVAITRLGNSSMQGHLTVLYKTLGSGPARKFMSGLAANAGAVFKGHTGVRKAVGRGEFHVGLVNHYYYFLEKAEGSPVDIIYPDQKASQPGAVMTVTGVAIVRGATHRKAAERFVDYLMTPRAQQIYADTNYEFPVLPGARSRRGVPPLESIRINKYPQGNLSGADFDAMLRLAQQSGMK